MESVTFPYSLTRVIFGYFLHVQVLKEFDKEHPNKVESVLVISGELGKDNLSDIIAMGAKNFLVKPFNEEQFKEKVAETLRASILKSA